MEKFEKKNLENQEKESSDFIKFGTFNAEEADMLKPELEKRGIPVKVLYPGTGIGRESSGNVAWTAYTLMIPQKDCKMALEICRKFNIKSRYRFRVPEALYGKSLYISGLKILAVAVVIALVVLVIVGRLTVGRAIGSFVVCFVILLFLLSLNLWLIAPVSKFFKIRKSLKIPKNKN